MIMPVLEYMEAEIGRVGNIYKGFMVEEAIGGDGPMRFWVGGMEVNRGSEKRDWKMSQWSCSWSMITVAQRMGSVNLVALSELVSCSLVNTGQILYQVAQGRHRL